MDLDITQFELLKDHVLVKSMHEEKNGELVNPKQLDDKPEFGVVEVASPDTGFKKGDVIIFGKYSTEEITNNGNTYYFVHSEDIKGVRRI